MSLQKTEFMGHIYLHPMIAERQREFAVSIKALRMLQEHVGNKYWTFKHVSTAEVAEWHAKAEALIPQCKPYDGDLCGLSRQAIRALGFDAKCRCGHEDGMHDTAGKCAVLDCSCERFTAQEVAAS